MSALAATDPHRLAMGTPPLEALVGPLVAFPAGTWAAMVETWIATREAAACDGVLRASMSSPDCPGDCGTKV